MATPRDAEEEERRLDAAARAARGVNVDAATVAGTTVNGQDATAASAAAPPPAALPNSRHGHNVHRAHQRIRQNLAENRRHQHGSGSPHPHHHHGAAATPSPPAPASATTNSNPTPSQPQQEPAPVQPHLPHVRSGQIPFWGAGGGIGAPPYRADGPVYGLVGSESDMLPSVLGDNDYMALLMTAGLGDVTTVAGGGVPLQSHAERMEERARAAALRAVKETHRHIAPAAAAPAEAPAAAAAAAGQKPAATDAPMSGDPAAHGGDHHHHQHQHQQHRHTRQDHHRGADGDEQHQPAPPPPHPTVHTIATGGASAPAAAPSAEDAAKPASPDRRLQQQQHLSPPNATAQGGRRSPGLSHDYGYEHDL